VLTLLAPDGSAVLSSLAIPGALPHASWGLPSATRRRELVGPGTPLALSLPKDEQPGWTEPLFDDGEWRRVRGPIGFDRKGRLARSLGEDIELERFRSGTSARIRATFEIDDSERWDILALRVRYDDGFLAWLDGVRVAQANAPEEVAWDAAATRYRDDALTEQSDLFLIDAAGLKSGWHALAVQVMNRTASSSDLFLDVSLDALVRAPPEREPAWLKPTPGLPNGNGARSVTPRPDLAPGSGFYEAPVRVEARRPSARAAVRFTLDGTLPDERSPIWRGPLDLLGSARVTVQSVEPGRLPSIPVGGSFAVLDPGLRATRSDLPLLVADTFGRGLDADGYLPALLAVFDRDPRGEASLARPPDLAVDAALKVRGSTTVDQPKPSYALELRDAAGGDLAAAMLGMPADADWVLHAPYHHDLAMLRNAFAYALSRSVGRYAPRTRFVELYVNTGGGRVEAADYLGVYLLTEKVERGPERVDIAPLRPEHVDDPEVTGGWLLKVDRADPGDRGFEAGGMRRLRYVDPDEAALRPEQAAWIRGYLDELGRALESPGEAWRAFIDPDSWIDHHILQELMKNPDSLRYSAFLYKQRGEPLHLGPLWDFDLALAAENTGDVTRDADPDPAGWTRSWTPRSAMSSKST
jgi:hypothetical protein